MTIGGWILFGILAVFITFAGIIFLANPYLSIAGKTLVLILIFALIFGLGMGMKWYYSNTASGQRALTDQKSELTNGLARTVTIYTADGEIIAQYQGKIDLEENAGGYVLFDFEGKRYAYYNCFVESIADIG